MSLPILPVDHLSSFYKMARGQGEEGNIYKMQRPAAVLTLNMCNCNWNKTGLVNTRVEPQLQQNSFYWLTLLTRIYGSWPTAQPRNFQNHQPALHSYCKLWTSVNTGIQVVGSPGQFQPILLCQINQALLVKGLQPSLLYLNCWAILSHWPISRHHQPWVRAFSVVGWFLVTALIKFRWPQVALGHMRRQIKGIEEGSIQVQI